MKAKLKFFTKPSLDLTHRDNDRLIGGRYEMLFALVIPWASVEAVSLRMDDCPRSRRALAVVLEVAERLRLLRAGLPFCKNVCELTLPLDWLNQRSAFTLTAFCSDDN